MNDLLSFVTFRTIFVFASTAFSILIVMLVTNIISVDEVVTILNLSTEASNAFKLVVSRIQEVSANIMDVISQLLNKLFSWTGADVDLSKIKVDVHKGDAGMSGMPANHVAPALSHGASK